MKTIYCTYFDKNYLARGLVMLKSLKTHVPEAKNFILCLDKLTYTVLKAINLQGCELMLLSEFESLYPSLREVKTTRSNAEYCWTLTPFLILYLMEKSRGGDHVVYMDADQAILGPMESVSEQLETCSILLQRHNFSEDLKDLLMYGKYNVGVVAAKNNRNALTVINWWKERCHEWCYAKVDGEMRFGDQKYLDYFHEQAVGVGEIEDLGVGVAPWNFNLLPLEKRSDGSIYFGSHRVSVCHFHSMKLLSSDVYLITPIPKYIIPLEALSLLYVPYIRELEKAYEDIRSIDEVFASGFAPDTELGIGSRLIVRTDKLDALFKDVPMKSRSVAKEFSYVEIALPKSNKNAWVGSFNSWEEASKYAGNYSNSNILEKTLLASRQVRDGEAACERDSVLLPERQYLWPSLSGLLLGAARNGGEVHVLDFGGALGSTYRTFRPYLSHLSKVRWHVVELPELALLGTKEFQTEELIFHDNLESCLLNFRVDGVLFGATLQYLPNPYGYIEALSNTNIDYLIIDRTSFARSGGHRICVQQVPKSIYEASYPCHIMDLEHTLATLKKGFDIVEVLPSMEGDIEDISFKGIIAVRTEAAGKNYPQPVELFDACIESWKKNPQLDRFVNLGCGSRFEKTWLNIDFAPKPPYVFAWNLTQGIPIEDDFADAIYHSNVIEHFSKADAPRFLKECWRVLKPGGILRVAAPDLEEIARVYLDNLERVKAGDSVAMEQYDWTVIELIDQLVRHYSGGEMKNYIAREVLPAENFVHQRIGTEYANLRNSIRKNTSKQKLPELSKTSVGKFRLGGEVHQWMYDRYSLGKLLQNVGFKNIEVKAFAQSNIQGFSQTLLEKNEDGTVYKPDSFYLEAVK